MSPAAAPLVPAVLLVAALLAWPGTSLRAQAGAHHEVPASVTAALAEIDHLLDTRQPISALAHLRALVEDPERPPALRGLRDGLVARFRRARFLAAYEPPDLETLLPCDVLDYDSVSHRALLRYNADHLALAEQWRAVPDVASEVSRDLAVQRGTERPPGPPKGTIPEPFTLEQTLFVPVRFSGRHAVTVIGEMPPAYQNALLPVLHAAAEGPRRAEVRFPFFTNDADWELGTIVWREGEGTHELAMDRRTAFFYGLEHEQDYRLRAEVFPRKGKLRTSLNDKHHLTAEIPPGRAGFVAVSSCPRVRSVEVEGILDADWLDVILGDLERDAYREFLPGYDPAEDLPAWLDEHGDA